MSTQFWFDLAGQTPPAIDVPGGTIAEGNVKTFPVLQGIAAYLLTLDPGGVRIPHCFPHGFTLGSVLRITLLEMKRLPLRDESVRAQTS